MPGESQAHLGRLRLRAVAGWPVVGRRMDGMAPANAPSAPAPGRQPTAPFEGLVRDALLHVHDVPYLRTHALAALARPAPCPPGLRPARRGGRPTPGPARRCSATCWRRSRRSAPPAGGCPGGGAAGGGASPPAAGAALRRGAARGGGAGAAGAEPVRVLPRAPARPWRRWSGCCASGGTSGRPPARRRGGAGRRRPRRATCPPR